MSYETYLARTYVPELDGLRAVSVLIVISAHMHDKVWRWLGGWLGVTVFFVLSGYLITMLALREEMQRGNVCLPAFYIRRCFRILPLYYVTLGVYCVYILVLGFHPASMLLGALPYYSLYLQEVPFFYGIDGPFFHSWSLGIEEKFYLLWPVLVFICWRGATSLRVVGTVALITALALAPALGPGELGNCLYPYYLILLGCLLALLLNDRRWFGRLRFLGTKSWSGAALAFLLALHFAKPHLPEFYWHHGDPVYALAISVFLASVVLGGGLIGRALRCGSLVFIGKLSYGIYLIHVLCIGAAQRLVPAGTGRIQLDILAYMLACALSIAAAHLLAVLFERPLIEVGRRWSKQVMARGGLKLAHCTPAVVGCIAPPQ